MADESFEQFGDKVVAALHASLTHITATVGTPPGERATDPEPAPRAASPAPGGQWVPYVPREDFPRPPGWQPPPSPPPEGTGFQFINVARLGDFILIAFHWYETGDETFIRVVDLRDLVGRKLPVDMAHTIILTNLLEDVGKGWYRHKSLRRIRGLTFIE